MDNCYRDDLNAKHSTAGDDVQVKMGVSLFGTSGADVIGTRPVSQEEGSGLSDRRRGTATLLRKSSAGSHSVFTTSDSRS